MKVTQYQQNILASWSAMLLNIIIIFFLTPYLITEFGTYKYGIWLLINSLIGYLNFVELGINISTGRFVNIHIGKKEYKQASEVLSTTNFFYFVLPLVILPIFWFFSPEIINNFILSEELADDIFYAVFFTASTFLVNLASANIRVRLNTKHRFDVASLIDIINTLTRTLLIIHLLYTEQDFSLTIISIFTLMGAFIALLLSVILSMKYGEKIPFLLSNVKYKTLKVILAFSGWVLISNIGAISINYTDNIIISYFINVSEVAIYSIGFMLITHLLTILSKINQVKIPSITQQVARGDVRSLNKEFNSLLFYSGIVTIPAICTFMSLVTAFIFLWLGAEFSDSTLISQVLAIPIVFNVVMQGVGAALWAKNIVKTLAILKITVAILNVVLSISFIQYFEDKLLAIAIATSLVSVIENIIIIPILASREINVSFITSAKINAVFLLLAMTTYSFIQLLMPAQITNWLDLIYASILLFSVSMLIVGAVLHLTKNYLVLKINH